MAGRLGIDFGTSNTVVAVWDDIRREGIPYLLPDYGMYFDCFAPNDTHSVQAGPGSQDPSTTRAAAVVPSLIHYGAQNQRWIGNQVHDKRLLESERTFSLMKRYISNRSPIKRRLDGKEISPFDAGRDFLTAILAVAATEWKVEGEEVVFSVPVEAYEHYENWLSTIAENAGMTRFRLIDEPSAAALGYGAHIQPGHVYLIIDFGGGTLDASVVLVEDDASRTASRRCRVLGKAGRELGGCSLDTWLMQEVLKIHNCTDADDDIRPISNELFCACRTVKEKLTFSNVADVSVSVPSTGKVLSARFDRDQFESILDEHDLFRHIHQTIQRALNTSRESGYSEDNIHSVLLVGGSILIPSVQKCVQRMFGKEKVHLDRPLDAVARGAAAYAAGVDFFDHIQHDYAIRWTNPQTGQYLYRTLVKRGTPYPTHDAIARLTVKATYAGQTDLGIAIFEVGEKTHDASGGGQPMELVFDPAGAARMVRISEDDQERRSHFWVNEKCPTFLHAQPPAQAGESRFSIEFGIDKNKRLTLTARDLKTGEMIFNEHPVVKLV